MRPFAAASLGLLLALSSPPAAFTEGGAITVTGEATVQAAPDMAMIVLGVTSQGETASGAMAANNRAVEAVIARLTAARIEERDLQTSNLSLNPNWADPPLVRRPTSQVTPP
jgi:uncharacterized protein YggE